MAGKLYPIIKTKSIFLYALHTWFDNLDGADTFGISFILVVILSAFFGGITLLFNLYWPVTLGLYLILIPVLATGVTLLHIYVDNTKIEFVGREPKVQADKPVDWTKI